MIVKILGRQTVRYIDCDSAIVKVSAIEVGTNQESYEMCCSFCNGKDMVIPLCENDQIYYLNNEGKTIDTDFRMACSEPMIN